MVHMRLRRHVSSGRCLIGEGVGVRVLLLEGVIERVGDMRLFRDSPFGVEEKGLLGLRV